ncbi:MAG: acyl-CoA dehydratase activase-related protein [Oscillospiraceae bacterium]|nr:acyl-CoA dehydratase activase-related protein [Oscillospiraceae bacterium]
MKRLGVDVGSTTLKCAVVDEAGELRFARYMRHYSKIDQRLGELLRQVAEQFPGESMEVSLSGSAGMGLAEEADLPFVQEVYAERVAVGRLAPGTDVVIELGGEDAKILFLTGGFEMRMNGTCAGGTGAFIDQMAALMEISIDDMDGMAARHEKLYTIASRCGVFAKSDIQPLLNQGARKEDVCASIFYAVVNQTIAGLAQGREIKGNILYLGGPLTYIPELRKSFDQVLQTEGLCPENALYYVAMGAAFAGTGQAQPLDELIQRLQHRSRAGQYTSCPPLFESQEEYDAFTARHRAASEGIRQTDAPSGPMYLGIDAGSTTVKALLCDGEGNILRPFYTPNNGNPIPIIRDYLTKLYRDFPDIEIRASAVTGYGEDIIRNAFGIDRGLVETVAHYTAAKKFLPEVDFILDIGGQDIKCFQIRNGAIDSIYLNEACSSGCGSFLQTFAGALGYSPAEFARLGLFAKKPVGLGSRCTVFMNSSVKQAQKDGATVEDIAAGLSISVVKNALYKVIRCANAESLGKHIVVQGGTFLNDAVLRAFERETGRQVVRPGYAALMGAYGAALYALAHDTGPHKAVLSAEELERFTHNVKAVTCSGCGNHCNLTVNDFGGGRRFIAGNRCDRPVSGKPEQTAHYDLYDYKLSLLEKYQDGARDPAKPTIGIPLGLNFYELLPFWRTFWEALGFNVIVSPLSTRELYLRGQYTIPSDTACYPAKLMHGHMEALLDQQPDAIFYPDMSYNAEEGLGVNHFNCPVVAYYPQVLRINVPRLGETTFIDDFVSIADRKQFTRRMGEIVKKYFPAVPKKSIKPAAQRAYEAYDQYFRDLRQKGQEYLDIAKSQGLPVIVLAGRPYHVDPEINHGVHTLICRLGAVVLTEDSVSHLVQPFPVDVRNQWTYHARLYAAAKFVAGAPPEANINLVQLVSFGCGVDAVTTDEVRAILEQSGKIYTQIKIDEISNMGAVNIRLRSLFSAIEDRERSHPA